MQFFQVVKEQNNFIKNSQFISLQFQRDIGIAKNYLSEDELKQLNLIVSMYLDFAELQATNGRLMKMQDWIQKLDDFLRISEKELLSNSGNVSHQKALEKAKQNTINIAKQKIKYISPILIEK